MQMTLGLIYKHTWICDRAVASIVGGSLMKVRYIQFLITGDVMAVYCDLGR